MDIIFIDKSGQGCWSLFTRLCWQNGFTIGECRLKSKSPYHQIDGVAFGDEFRADLLINDHLLIEVKSVDKLAPLHTKQVLTYLRCLNLPLGLLINFGGGSYKEGFKRVMNNHNA